MLNQVFGTSTKVKTLVEGSDGDIWFAQGDEVGYLARSRERSDSLVFKKKMIPFLKNKLVGGFEFIYPYQKDKVLFGTDKGFLFYDIKIQNQYPENILLRNFTFDNNLNAATFEYVLPYLSQSLNIQYAITWTSPKEQVFEMPTGGAAIMRQSENLLYLARKEQCLALSTQLKTSFKITDFKIYRIFPSGEVQYLHPKDGVFPEKVNAGRVGVGNVSHSIGKNLNPSEIKFTTKSFSD